MKAAVIGRPFLISSLVCRVPERNLRDSISILSFRIVSTPRKSHKAPQHGAGVREEQCPEELLVLYEAIPGAQTANLHLSIWRVKGAHQVLVVKPKRLVIWVAQGTMDVLELCLLAVSSVYREKDDWQG